MNGYLINKQCKLILYTVVRHWVVELRISQQKAQIHITHHTVCLDARLRSINLISIIYIQKQSIPKNSKEISMVIMGQIKKSKKKVMSQSLISKKRVCYLAYWKINFGDSILFSMPDTTMFVRQRNISDKKNDYVG